MELIEIFQVTLGYSLILELLFWFFLKFMGLSEVGSISLRHMRRHLACLKTITWEKKRKLMYRSQWV